STATSTTSVGRACTLGAEDAAPGGAGEGARAHPRSPAPASAIRQSLGASAEAGDGIRQLSGRRRAAAAGTASAHQMGDPLPGLRPEPKRAAALVQRHLDRLALVGPDPPGLRP